MESLEESLVSDDVMGLGAAQHLPTVCRTKLLVISFKATDSWRSAWIVVSKAVKPTLPEPLVFDD